MPSPNGVRSNNKDNILNTLRRLEGERATALEALGQAGPQERVRLRAQLVFLERRLKWYRGRTAALPQDSVQAHAERDRRIARNVEGLVEVHKAAGVDLGRTGTAQDAP